MNKISKSILVILTAVLMLGNLTSCEDFFTPSQDIRITEDQLYSDWYEYRAAIMGLYGLQQKLVEQLVILGELRSDLLTVTPNADADLVEINNFSISKENKYASPQNFFKLIAATNRFISILEKEHPDVLNPATAVNNYDRLYGEALTMRAWAYFNAVRIYGKVPFIDERISTIEEINDFLGSTQTYIDSVYIEYSIDGYNNDTIRNQETVLEKQYFDTDMVIRHFTSELEQKIKAVGVNHYINNQDNSWEVTIWSDWGYNTLMGHMYLTLGDLTKAAYYFEKVLYNNSTNYRYQLDNSFSGTQWGNIFMNIDSKEHIFSLKFSKTDQQTNDFQRLFESWGANEYMLKPTKVAVHKWETQWRGAMVSFNSEIPDSSKTLMPGLPGDVARGYGFSYVYVRGGTTALSYLEYSDMLEYKRIGDERSIESLMESMDTIVYKYSIGKEPYDQDPDFIIYRAGSVNLYLAEIYNYWNFENSDGVVKSYIQNALNIINNGSNYDPSANRRQLGVRGRVGLGSGEAAFKLNNIILTFDPFTNKVIGHTDLTGKLRQKQYYLENQIMNERARELAFEGERFYDLMRVALRRGDASYLADIVSSKYSGSKKDYIKNLLLDENNWYIHYFDEE